MILLPIFVSVTNKTKFMPEICRFFGINPLAELI